MQGRPFRLVRRAMIAMALVAVAAGAQAIPAAALTTPLAGTDASEPQLPSANVEKAVEAVPVPRPSVEDAVEAIPAPRQSVEDAVEAIPAPRQSVEDAVEAVAAPRQSVEDAVPVKIEAESPVALPRAPAVSRQLQEIVPAKVDSAEVDGVVPRLSDAQSTIGAPGSELDGGVPLGPEQIAVEVAESFGEQQAPGTTPVTPDQAMPDAAAPAPTVAPAFATSAAGERAAAPLTAVPDLLAQPTYGWTAGVGTYRETSRANAPGGAPGGGQPMPAGGGSASAGGGSSAPAIALLILLALALPKLLKSFKEAPAFLRPAAFVALLERPG